MKMIYSNYGECYVVESEDIIYCQADDHYTHVYYDLDEHVMLPFGLAHIEEGVKKSEVIAKYLVRTGRKYIINLNKIFHVNMLKQEVVLLSNSGKHITLHVSRPACQTLMDILTTGEIEWVSMITVPRRA